MALISNGSMVLLKYKLNNVCDADNRPAKDAQRTMIILIYHNMLWLSMQKYQNGVLIKGVVKNAMRIISVLNAYYGTNAYCVRIKCVLVFNKGCPYVCKQFLLGLQAMKKT